MRKRSARKWLHFILDLLPVIFIPVFMIYSHRHTIDTYSVQAEETKVVNFNQYVVNGNYVDDSNIDFLRNTFDYEVSDNTLKLTRNNNTWVDSYLFSQFVYNKSFVENHKYYIHLDAYTNFSQRSIPTIRFYPAYISFGSFELHSNTWVNYNTVVNGSFTNDNYFNFFIQLLNGDLFTENDYLLFKNFMLIDLTYMFGVGNEPTLEQFNAWYTEDYYDYTTGRKEIIYTGNTITYDDTDILSQIMYAMYNATDKYFNFNKLFNMQDLYNWVQANMFGGNAPLIIPIVWNIIVYELFMDILFLIYAVFMFFIDFATDTLQRFLDRSR